MTQDEELVRQVRHAYSQFVTAVQEAQLSGLNLCLEILPAGELAGRQPPRLFTAEQLKAGTIHASRSL